MSDERKWWERVERVPGLCGEWVVKDDGKTIAAFYGADAERNAELFREGLLDPRNTTYTDGVLVGMECFDSELDEMRAALVWLSAQQSRLAGEGLDVAGDIFREACAEGRRIVKERGHR